MATIATCITPHEIATVDAVSAPITARFPVPATAWGFCTEVADAVIPIERVNRYLMGVLHAEGDHMEPTIGQIWPQ